MTKDTPEKPYAKEPKQRILMVGTPDYVGPGLTADFQIDSFVPLS
jgi:hypothetical protein